MTNPKMTFAALLLTVTGFACTGCFSTLEPRGPVPAASSLNALDLEPWATVLNEHVDDGGRVDYAGLAKNRDALDRFVAALSVVGPASRPELFPTRDDRLAYYLNAYNALVLFNVLEHYPLDSVNDGKVGFFYLTRFRLDGDRTNLYDLENSLIRPEFKEPRVHFALNCASVGCPRLPRVPFRAEELEQQLAHEAHVFLHEVRNVSVEDGEVVLSEVFDWFEEDFARDPLAWIREQATDLDLPAEAKVRFRPWDWALNEQR
jgi:hypothetical protein